MVLACRIQQASDGALDYVILALAGVAEDDVTVLVDDVLGWPVLIAPGVPGRRIVVLRDRIGDAMLLQRGLHVAGRPSNGNSGVWMPTTTSPLSL